MTKAEKVRIILAKLNELYPDPAIPLNFTDPYTLLVAVMLSAQCTDERVNKITPLLFKKASTPQKMVRLGQKAILEIIRPCGLGPAKSKGIFESSKILLEKYGGQVPQDMQALETLPGVGHKTASVVMIQAFHTPAFPVDTHIHRLLYRWGFSDGTSVVKSEREARKWFPEERWIKLHLQIIYFGREYCPARSHQRVSCPLCSVVGRKKMER